MLMKAFFCSLQVPEQFQGITDAAYGTNEEFRALNEKLLPSLQQLERITEVSFSSLAGWILKSRNVKKPASLGVLKSRDSVF
mgnify:CR=1 FL=1